MVDYSVIGKQANLVGQYEQGNDNLTPEEQWNVVNEILSIKGYMIPDIQRIQLFLKQEFENVHLRRVNQGEVINAKQMTDDDRMSVLKEMDYVKNTQQNGSNFDLDECFKCDINAARLIREMSTSEKMDEALSVSHVFDTTKESIEKDLQAHYKVEQPKKQPEMKSDTVKTISPKDIAKSGQEAEITKKDIDNARGIIGKIRSFFKER